MLNLCEALNLKLHCSPSLERSLLSVKLLDLPEVLWFPHLCSSCLLHLRFFSQSCVKPGTPSALKASPDSPVEWQVSPSGCPWEHLKKIIYIFTFGCSESLLLSVGSL